ncbi:ATP-binding cassette domain-containing protein [Streptomyces hygroscopicus]|uniref:ATP-binding cassette domain-containing protein n=1 Tax=Streptomyces hygroscopicus TaxID=1912 RepID=UPI003A1000A6
MCCRSCAARDCSARSTKARPCASTTGSRSRQTSSMTDPLPVAGPLATPAASRSGGSPPALRVEGLRKTYEDGFTAVAGLDLEIPDGAFFGLLGPNGAGKTTLIGSVCTSSDPPQAPSPSSATTTAAVRPGGCWVWLPRRSTSTGSCPSGRS